MSPQAGADDDHLFAIAPAEQAVQIRISKASSGGGFEMMMERPEEFDSYYGTKTVSAPKNDVVVEEDGEEARALRPSGCILFPGAKALLLQAGKKKNHDGNDEHDRETMQPLLRAGEESSTERSGDVDKSDSSHSKIPSIDEHDPAAATSEKLQKKPSKRRVKKFWRKQSRVSLEPSNKSDAPLVEDAFSNLRDKYVVDQSAELGSGQYGVVRKCVHRETRQEFAVKSVRKARVNQIDILREEVRLLREVSHPNIIKLVDVFEDEEDVHLVTELAAGGELFDRIIAKKESPEGHFSEREAAVIVRQILDAVTYCHDTKNIIHRDLKPENFLFATEASGAAVKIIDFGYATRHAEGHKPMKDELGTPLYMAPEVMNRKYGRSCDVWSVGIVAYTLLAGYPPFNGRSEAAIYASVREGKFSFPSPLWDDASAGAKDFICKVLKKDPKQRITAAAALHHPWIREFAPDPEEMRKVARRRASRRLSASMFAY